METIFTKIIKREIPASIVYEDEESIAFLDINPVSKGHTLLITKEPYKWMTDVPEELIARMFIKTKKMMEHMKKQLPCDFVQIGIVGNEVPHFHIHLIPRKLDEGVTQTNRPHDPYESKEEMEMYAQKLK
ncbi:MAG: HIT family protein [bacterium]